MVLHVEDLYATLFNGDPPEIPPERLRILARHDLVAARRTALLNLLWNESTFTSEGLISRVEDLLGRGCFTKNPKATLRCDLKHVRQILAEQGYSLAYRRKPGNKGYYIPGRPLLAEHLRRQITACAAEVDPVQIAIYCRLEAWQRVWQLTRLSDWLCRANVHRTQHVGMVDG